MKAQILTLLSCLSVAAEVVDLGVISPQQAVRIEQPSTRPDFLSYTLQSQSGESLHTLTITNDIIRIEDLAPLPSGRSIIAIWSNFRDGSHSDVALYTVDLRRSNAPAPLLSPVGVIVAPELPNSLTNELRKIRTATPSPPLPAHEMANWPHHYYSTNIAGYQGPIEEYLSRTNPPTWNPADYTNQEPTGLVSTEVTIRFYDDAANAWRPVTPLPGGTNNSYAQYLDWLADRKGKRRNE